MDRLWSTPIVFIFKFCAVGLYLERGLILNEFTVVNPFVNLSTDLYRLPSGCISWSADRQRTNGLIVVYVLHCLIVCHFVLPTGYVRTAVSVCVRACARCYGWVAGQWWQGCWGICMRHGGGVISAGSSCTISTVVDAPHRAPIVFCSRHISSDFISELNVVLSSVRRCPYTRRGWVSRV